MSKPFAATASPRPAISALRDARLRMLRMLSGIAGTLDRHAGLALSLLVLCTLPYAALKALSSLLTCDEVYTLRIAQQPSVAEMLRVSRQIDLHPPLHYFTERLALATHLPLLLAARLPGTLATTGTVCLLFAFTRGRLGSLFAFCAATVFWFSPGLDFAWSNRPYALWLFLLAAACALWQRAGGPHRSAWVLPGLFACIAGMIMDYMAGLLCVLPLVAAELVRTRGRRRDWPLLTALLLPCAGGLLYVRPLHDFSTNTFAPVYMDWAGTTAVLYGSLLQLPACVVAACLLAAALLSWQVPIGADRTLSAKPRPSLPSAAATLPAEELMLAWSLFLLPLLFACIAAVRHTQFFERYGACGALGVALLAPWCLLRLAPSPRTALALLVLGLPIACAVNISHIPFRNKGHWRSDDVTGVPAKRLDELDSSLPIVVAQPLSYTEMNERESGAVLDRTYYLYDRAAAQQFSGSTIFETMAVTQRLLHYRTKVAPLQPFLAEHPRFYLTADYTHPEAWLVRKLVSSGAVVQYLGKFDSTYAEDDLYFVTLPGK